MNCLDSTGASPFHPNAEAVTVLAHMFAEIEGLTNTRQRTHRKPPLSSITPSQDPATCSTSLRSPSRLRSGALHLHTTAVRTLATPHVQGDFTSWEDVLGPHTETPHNARVRVTRFPAWRVTESGVREPSSPTRTQKPKSYGNDHREPVWPVVVFVTIDGILVRRTASVQLTVKLGHWLGDGVVRQIPHSFLVH